MVNHSNFKALSGSDRPQIAGSSLIGPVEAKERIVVTLLLRQRPGSPELPDLEYWQFTRPGERKFLSVEEFFQTYGTSQEDVDEVLAFLSSKKLRVIHAHVGKHRIEVEGRADEINAAFGVKLNLYRAPRRFQQRRVPGENESKEIRDEIKEQIYRGFEGHVHLPENLSEVVTAVIGLDNRRLGGPAVTGAGDPPSSNYLSPQVVGQLYNFPTTGAAGQTIGLFEAADDGAAYLHGDIHDFITSLPPGYNVQPYLTDIGLLGEVNNPALVTPYATAGGGVLEATLDVAVAAAIAQGANINVYFTQDTELGWEAFLDRAIFPPPADNPPSVISASWILTTSDDPFNPPGEGIGLLSNPASMAHVLHRKLRQAATRGITVFMAIGDWGSANQNTDGSCYVSYPNSDPWVTSCGGTILGDILKTSSCAAPLTTFEEWTWSEAFIVSQFRGGEYEATGGGVSATFPRPSYQISSGILPISKNDGGIRRGLPDVAGMVAMNGFFFAGLGGPGRNPLFGTSAVSPLYAALIAVINGYLGHNTGFLNPTLYTYGAEICNDIKIGNNLVDYTAAPFYSAGIGWDPCTGWGSINGVRLLAALAPAPIVASTIACGGFGDVCVGGFADEILTINNSGFSDLLISKITVTPPDFLAPGVSSYPLAVSPGGSIDVVIRFKPTSLGSKTATVFIFSNELFSPHQITVTGAAAAPRLVLGIADSGNFGNVCVGSFADEHLVVNNGGKCTLLVNGITSSSSQFLVPEILVNPIAVAPGVSVSLPIRFQPTVYGPTPAGVHLTVNSNDPGGPRSLLVYGNAPSGKITVTGSTFFGEVEACSRKERTISICNVGDCRLHVTGVAFKRKNPHWKLINNPFPATLHPGSCLAVVIRYKATEKYPRACELVITSDDPVTPVKILEVLAFTNWCGCGKEHCESCCKPCRDEHDDDAESYEDEGED